MKEVLCEVEIYTTNGQIFKTFTVNMGEEKNRSDLVGVIRFVEVRKEAEKL